MGWVGFTGASLLIEIKLTIREEPSAFQAKRVADEPLILKGILAEMTAWSAGGAGGADEVNEVAQILEVLFRFSALQVRYW